MFPVQFAFRVIERITKPGANILDPFAGRGSSIFAAGALGRSGTGIEINPVGWLYSHVKLQPANPEDVLLRLKSLVRRARSVDERWASLPPFFYRCYSPQVLRFLITARKLRWRTDSIDATLAVFVLLYLHGHRGYALSNQMRDGKSMAPDYAIRWWKEKRLRAPSIDVEAFLTKRIRWRYKFGAPRMELGQALLGDSIEILPELNKEIRRRSRKPFDAVFTSPPYCGVTNYQYDQWLRLWFLGESPHPTAANADWRGRFESRDNYQRLIETVFSGAAESLAHRGVWYVRTDARAFTLDTTLEVLRRLYPRRKIRAVSRPYRRLTQTALFGDTSQKPGEVDLIIGASL
jgi:hypothetical protein